MSSVQARRANRDRLPTAILLAVLFHAVVFVALELFLRFAPQREPEYTGPMLVQLEELPVVQEAREAAAPEPRPAPSQGQAAASPAPSAGVSVTPAQAPAAPAQAAAPQLPSGPPLRAAGEPVPATAPKASPFRMEGAPSQQGKPQPVGESFQIASDQPTLPPSGVPAQGPPLRAEAPGTGQKSSSVPLEAVDRALAAAGKAGTASGGGAGGPGTPGTAASAGAAGSGTSAGAASGSPGGAGTGSGQNYSIVWENSALGREPLSMPKPVIPSWVSRAGLRLTVDVDFVLTSQGVLHSVRVTKSSGYSDVDSSVLDAVRRWKFRPGGKKDVTVNGRVSYLILPR